MSIMGLVLNLPRFVECSDYRLFYSLCAVWIAEVYRIVHNNVVSVIVTVIMMSGFFLWLLWWALNVIAYVSSPTG